MLRTHQTQINLIATVDEVWKTIIEPDFARDFLPEISRDTSNLSLFKLANHKNPLNLMPAYMVRNKTISWDCIANTSIKLARKDLDVEINNIDITLQDNKYNTLVTIEVNYASKLNSKFLLAERIIKGLFSHKLEVLKQDLELNRQERHQMQPAYN